MEEKISALIRQEFTKSFKRARESNVLQSKWFFKTNTDAEGKIERFKAQLVSCGNEQKFGVDFFLSFVAA